MSDEHIKMAAYFLALPLSDAPENILHMRRLYGDTFVDEVISLFSKIVGLYEPILLAKKIA